MRCYRDRLVVGINDDTIQRHLLAETKLDFKKALETSLSMETDAKNARDIQRGGTTESLHQVKHKQDKKQSLVPKKYHKKPQNQASKENPDASSGATRTKPCHRCGGTNHGPETCKFRNANCNYCHRQGHIVRMFC